jgi:hypothetical protein
MEILEFLCIMIPVLMVGFLVMRWIALADARARIELQKRLQKSKEKTSGNQRAPEQRMSGGQRQQPQEQPFDIGPWVPELLENFGIDPEVIYEEEMPEDLKAFMPVVKGYVNAQGGIPGIAAQLQKSQEDNSGPQSNSI